MIYIDFLPSSGKVNTVTTLDMTVNINLIKMIILILKGNLI